MFSFCLWLKLSQNFFLHKVFLSWFLEHLYYSSFYSNLKNNFFVLCVYLFVCLSTYLSVCQHICLFVWLYFNLSFSFFVISSLRLTVCLIYVTNKILNSPLTISGLVIGFFFRAFAFKPWLKSKHFKLARNTNSLITKILDYKTSKSLLTQTFF